jgi:hypothetical protein
MGTGQIRQFHILWRISVACTEIKTALRHAQNRSQQKVEIALAQALQTITVRGDRRDSSIVAIPYINI